MRFIRLPALFAALLLASAVHANPPETKDDLGSFIADQGFIEKLGAVGDKVGAKASELVVNAMGFLGVPYKRGGSTVETGFDCSGFVKAIYEQSSGLILPRSAAQQAAATEKIDRTDLQPGDLVFFNTMRKAFSHVGIYIGNGKFIHSPHSGAEVRVEDMDMSYWRKRFNGARRVMQGEEEKPKASAAQ